MANPVSRTASQPVAPPTVQTEPADPMEELEARMEAKFESKLKEMDLAARARIKEAEEKAEAAVKRALDIEDAAKVKIAAAEATAKAQIDEAQRTIMAAMSPGAAAHHTEARMAQKVTARSKEDVEVLCLKTLPFARAGGRTYQFKSDEVIPMDPSHAVEYEATGWVKRLKSRR